MADAAPQDDRPESNGHPPRPAAPHRLSKQPWITVLLAFGAVVGYVVVQTIAVVAYLVVQMALGPQQDIGQAAEQAALNGDVLVACTWPATIAAVLLVLLFARLQCLTTVRDFLGLTLPSMQELIRWVLLTLLLIVVIDGITWLTGHEIVPQSMRDVYASTTWPILMWLTLIVAAPLGEELLFRGLMFQGLVETQLGFIGAAVISSLVWTVLHIQYDARMMISIFIVGLLLAAARYFTRSTVLCMCMHAVMNLVATLEMVLSAPQAPVV